MSTRDELGAALKKALQGVTGPATRGYWLRRADTLLAPGGVVDRIAAKRAAEELRNRAHLVSARAAEEEGDVEDALSEVAAWLNARAAALDPT